MCCLGNMLILAAEQQQIKSSDAKRFEAKPSRYTVTDFQGKPVAGATVEYWWGNDGIISSDKRILSTKQTGTDGQVELAMDTSGECIISKNGLSVWWMRYQEWGPRETNIVLSAPSFLEGVVKDEHGNAVAGAKVFVSGASSRSVNGPVNSVFGQAIEKYLHTTTGADGKFRIEGIPTNATAFLYASAPLKSPTFDENKFNNLSFPYSAGQKDIVLNVVPEGVIEGKIVVEGSSDPMPMGTINAFSGANGAISQKVSFKSDGTFRISGPPLGNCRLVAQFGTNGIGSLFADSVNVNVESGKTNTGIVIRASRGGVMELKVVSARDHSQIQNIMTRVSSEKKNFTGMTDSNGVVCFRVPAGDYQVRASARGWASKECKTTIEEGKTNSVQIELVPPNFLTGIVRDPAGKGVRGLSIQFVNIFGRENSLILTEDDGSFEAEFPRNNEDMNRNGIPCVFVRDVEHNLAAVQPIEEDTQSVELKLAPAITISGHVECDGKPLKKPVATLVFWSGNSGMHFYGLSREGNTPGQFEIPCLPVGCKYGVMVTAEGYGEKLNYNVVSPDTEAGRVELETFELKLANLKIEGKVVDENDKPLSGVWINMSGDNQPRANTNTDKDGRFAFNNVCEGQINIFCNYNDGRSGRVSVEGGDTNVIVKIGERINGGTRSTTKKFKLSGTVNGTNGVPESGVLVTIFATYEGEKEVKTDTNGTFLLNWTVDSSQQRDINFVLCARNKDLGLAVMQEITEDMTNITVQLQKAVNITGYVENDRKEPIKGAKVLQMLKMGNYFYRNFGETYTDAQGHFQAMCLPVQGDFSFDVIAKGYGSGNQQLTIEAGKDVELSKFTLQTANLDIGGQVLGENEKPMSGVEININGKGQPSESTTTDKAGHFHFKVCEGKVHLFAQSQSGYANTIANAGNTNLLLLISHHRNAGSESAKKHLKGSLLPDLKKSGLDTTALPSDKALLLCLFDANQRPSRAIMRKFQEQADSLKQKGIIVAGLQIETIAEDAFKEWKESSHVTFPVGRVENRKTEKWISTAESLPWLILTDPNHKVVSEGFAFDEIDNRIGKIARSMALKAKGPSPSPWTQSPGPIRANTATLNGMVAPNGTDSKAWFQWGTTKQFENVTQVQEVGKGNGVVRVSAPITGLVPGTIYHCRLVASTGSGITNFGPDFRFTTGMGVFAWGASENGNCKVPADLTNAVAVACGHGHSLAIRNDGTVAFWGGEGSFTKYHTNKIPEGLSNVVAVAGGYAQSYAVKEDGNIVAWGGYLNQAVPSVPEGLHNVIAIAAGDKHAIALKSDGTVVVWGNETGNGETQVPEEVTNVVAVASGSNHCIAQKADGSLVEWGATYSEPIPEELDGVVAISAEAFRFLALQEDGVVFDWGVGDFQHLPPGGITNAVAIAAGLKHSAAVLTDGTVTAWGNNESHQLDVPKNLFDVVSVAASDEHTIALGKQRSK